MKTMIENYRNLPGVHCGTTAMRNLLYHYCKLELNEEIVFGLGSGLDAIYIKDDAIDPAAIIFGRSITLEADVAGALGIDYREQPEPDNAKAWEDVRREVSAGRPTMLTGDIFYLDYRNYTVRFPAHRFVLLGYDDQKQIAYVADRVDPEPQACSYNALAQSRNPKSGITTFNLWGGFFDSTQRHSLEQAAKLALARCASRMTGADTSQADLLRTVIGSKAFVAVGLHGLTAFADDLASWREREDARQLATYAFQCIEKFGTGGGNFRKMYAAFLDWAHHLLPDIVGKQLVVLAEKSAGCWTDLARLLQEAAQENQPQGIWQRCAQKAMEIVILESELFKTIKNSFAA